MPFFIFLVLLAPRLNFFVGDFATSVVPGWHTTIFPPQFILGLVITITLSFVTIGYWKLAKKTDQINTKIFLIHLLLTLPIIIFNQSYIRKRVDEILISSNDTKTYELIIQVSIILPILFFVGQILFAWYFFTTLYIKEK